MALQGRCLAFLLLISVTEVYSGPAHEEPIILNDETKHDPPIILNDQVPLSPLPPLDRYMKNAFEMTNPTHVNGEELFESDMLLTPEQRMAIRDRKAIAYLSSRWPAGASGNPTVPYIFNDSSVNQAAVKNGMAHWEQNSCVRFIPATNLSAPYLRFIYGSGCYSYVGMLNQAGQDISIGSGCEGLGTVAHEIGHALGFFHEQCRSDRDDYVYVNFGNVISGKEKNFWIGVDNNYSVPYDYSSDMHYGIAYFSKNGNPTLVTKDPIAQPLIGQRNGLSHYDKLVANRMYYCISKWLTACGLASDPCLNNGYTGSSCTCICPPGTTGTRCETITGGYYDSLKSSCTSVITTAGNITSPNYPSNYPAGSRCMKVIKAPPCYTIQLKFNFFQLYPQSPYCNNTMCCYFDFLEIRTTDPYNGTVFCDTMISAGQTFTSSSGQMLLYFQTESNFYSGWSAQLSFILIPGCLSSTDFTTTSSTTTTTERTTTTLPPANVCPYSLASTGGYYWTSPRFGLQNYPDSFQCSLTFKCSTPSWAIVTFNKFSLENKTSCGTCDDFLSFTQVYNLANLTFCGLQSGSIFLPTCNLVATFSSNSVINSLGYNVTIAMRSSACHQLITTGCAGSTGNISAPAPATTWQNTGCEWWIQAPAGNVISLQFISVSLSGNCATTSILLNGYGDNLYPQTSSTQYCGTAVPPIFTSTTNKLNVMYYSTNLNSPFIATWTVKTATG